MLASPASDRVYSDHVLTPQADLREGIVLVLGRRAGSARRAEALNLLAVLLGGSLTDEDREPVRSRQFEEKWRNRASYERAQMIREDLLVDRNDGVWELNADGWTLFRVLDR